MGEEGKEEEEGGAGLQFSGLPQPAPGKPEPLRAAADPALATGEERSHLPRPAPGSRKGGGKQRRSGSESERFRSCFMCDSVSLFSLRVWGGVGSCLRGGAPAGRPAPSLAPHFPNPGDLGAGLWRSGPEAARGRSPSPGAEVGQVLGKGKCRGSLPLLASPGWPTLRGNLPCCKLPGPPSKDSPWPGRGGTFGGGGYWSERPEGGGEGMKGL